MHTLKNKLEASSYRYGLEATDNSKAGPSFALPPEKTCDTATQTCKRVCYKKGVTYNTPGSIAKRERNFQTVEKLLALGGPRLLAEALIELIDEYKPKDWFVAQATGGKTARPFTFRIHDLGDYPEFRNTPSFVSRFCYTAGSSVLSGRATDTGLGIAFTY